MFCVVMHRVCLNTIFFPDNIKKPATKKSKMNCLEPVCMRIHFPKNVNKTYFGCLKLSHCNFEAITLELHTQCFFYNYIYQSMKFINLYGG